MMSWTYRTLYNEDDEMFYITEAYYDNPDDKLYGYIADGVQPVGETKAELKECLERMLECFDKPTITHRMGDWLTEEEKREQESSNQCGEGAFVGALTDKDGVSGV